MAEFGSGDLVLIRMQLTGGAEVEAEATRASTAIKGISATADEATASTAATTGGIAKSLKSHGASIMSFGSTLTRSVSLPLLAIGGASALMAANFQRQMSLISTQAGGTAKEVKALEKQVLNLSEAGKTKFTPTEMAKSLYFISSAGIHGTAKMMKTLAAANTLATIGNSDLEHTTFGLMGSYNALGKEGKNLTNVIGGLNATVGSGHLRMEELVAAMGTGLTGAAKSFGLNIQGMGGAIAFFTRMGEPAVQAATRLRMSIVHLATDATEKGTKALEKIGLSGAKLGVVVEKTHGITAAVKLLAEHLQGLTKTEQKQIVTEAFGGGRYGTQAMEAILRHQLLAKTEREVIEKSTPQEVAREKREAEAQSLVKLEKAWSMVEGSLIRLGTAILPVVVPLLGQIAGFVASLAKGFSSLSPGVKSLVIDFGLALAVGGPLVVMFGAMVAGAGAIISPVGLVVIGVAALAAGMIYAYTHSQALRTVLAEMGGTAKEVFGWIVNAGHNLLNFFEHNAIGKVVAAVFTEPISMAEHLVSLYHTLQKLTQEIFGAKPLTASQSERFRREHPGDYKRLNKGLHEQFGVGVPQFNQKERSMWDIRHGLISGPGGHLVHAGVHPHRRHAAGAESWGGGLAMVGEQGPELMYLPPGVDLMPNGPTRRWQEDNPAAPGRLAHHGPRVQRRLLPIVLKLDGKTIAQVTAQVHEDAEARA